MKKSICVWSGLAAAAMLLVSISGAEAFWAVRGAHGGFAVGGLVRAPVVADHYYAGGCWRCAPYYPAGAVAAGAAIGAAAATAATQPSAVIINAPPPPPTMSAAAPPPPASSGGGSSSSQPACFSSLNADAKVIYSAARSAGANASNVRDVVTAQTRSLVMSGKIPQSSAKADAQSAGQCIAQAK